MINTDSFVAFLSTDKNGAKEKKTKIFLAEL
jgi:hypothetical protein